MQNSFIDYDEYYSWEAAIERALMEASLSKRKLYVWGYKTWGGQYYYDAYIRPRDNGEWQHMNEYQRNRQKVFPQ
jgi:hypothetical protein